MAISAHCGEKLSPAARVAGLVWLIFFFAISSVSAAVVDATWNTGAVGDWSDGSNWDTDPVVPDNAADTYNVFLFDGETTLDSTFTIDDLTLDGGALVGAGALDVGGRFTWLSGALGGDGATAEININGPAIIDSGFHNFAAVTVNLAGNTTWVNGNIISIEPPEGGVVNNSGTFEIQGDVLWFWNTTAAPVFNNQVGGVVNRTTNTGLVEIWAAFNNDGEVNVQTGTMRLEGGGTSSGAFAVDPNATLWFSDFNEGFGNAGSPTTTLTVDSIVDSAGTVVFGNSFGNATNVINGSFDSAAVVADPGELGQVRFTADSFYGDNSPGSLEVVSGTTTFDGAFATVTDATIRGLAAVNVVNSGSLSVTGDLTVEADGVINLGDPNGSGDLSIGGTTPKSILGSGEVVFGGTSGSTISGSGLTIGANVTIRGAGSIFAGGVGNGANAGTITTDVNGQTNFLRDFSNSGSIVATNGASIDYSDFDFLGALVNTGSIDVSGGGNLVTNNLVNQNTVSIDGGTLRLAGENFTNAAGTITGNNATIEFRNGTFTFADVGTINRTNTELELGSFAILDNTGQTLDLDNSTDEQGTWTMRGGTIKGGSIQTSGGATLLFPATGSSRFGTLDGVTLNTGPTMGDGSSMFVDNGLTLDNATVDLSNGGTGAASMTFQLGTRTLSGAGTVILGNNFSAGVGPSLGGGNVTIGSDIVIRGQTGFVNRATNQGTVSADVSGGQVAFRDSINDVGGKLEATNGGILRLENDWDNNGTIDVQAGSLLWLQGTNATADIGTIQRDPNSTVRLSGTLTNTGDTLDVQADIGGDFELRQAVIVGGTISSSGSARLIVDSSISGSRLEGVTLSADVGFADATQVSVGVLTIAGGITLDGGTIDVQNNIAPELNFTGATQTVGGTGEIIVRANGGSNSILNRSINGGLVTFGPDVTIRVGASSLFNSVLIDGRFNNAAAGFVNQGTLIFENGQQSMVDLRNEGTIYVDPDPNTNHLHLFSSQNETVFVQTAGEFIIDGKVLAQVDMEIRGGKISGAIGELQFLPGAPKKLVAKSGGTVSPGTDGVGGLSVDGDVVLDDGGRFEATLSGASSGVLYVVAGQFQSANGDLDLLTTNDYLDIVNLGGATPGESYLIAQAEGSVLGVFDNVTSGYDVIYAGNRIFVRTGDSGDFDFDGDVDGIDFLAWQRGLGIMSGATPAEGDADRDGDVDQDDLAIWEVQYGTQLPPASLQAVIAAVPEPASLAIFLGFSGIICCRRRRCAAMRAT